MASICVIIVAYRSDATIEQCLATLAAQTDRDFEVILVDNGLTPALGTLSVVYKSQLNLKILMPAQNLGFAAGNNFGARQAAADTGWFALLNPDAYPRPDWLASFRRAQRLHQGVAVFGSLQMEALRPGICDGLGDCYHIFGLAWRHGHGHPLPANSQDRPCFSPCAAASFYRADAFRAVGGFDADYFCYFEDVDLGFRLRLNGERCMQLTTTIVDHLGGGSGAGAFAVQHGMRNMVWTYLKNMPQPFFILFLPGLLMAVLALGLRHAFAGNGGAVRDGLRGAWHGIRPIWAKRQIIQARRRITAWSIVREMTWLPLQPLRHFLRRR